MVIPIFTSQQELIKPIEESLKNVKWVEPPLDENDTTLIALTSMVANLDENLVIENNFKTFKRDIKIICGDYRRYTDNIYEKTIFFNSLFGPVGLAFIDGYATAIEASSIVFYSKQELDKFIKDNRPLIYVTYISYPVNFDSIFGKSNVCEIEKKERYILRYFPALEKLPRWKFYLQFLSDRINIQSIRIWLYKTLSTK
jgi:hypothetical protein